MPFTLGQFDYTLPPNRIASSPAHPRDHSRLMVLNRQTKSIRHHHFHDLPSILPQNAVLVLNQTKVFPARLFAHKPTGGTVELLLLEQVSPNSFNTLTSPGLKTNQILIINSNLQATTTIPTNQQGMATISFNLSGPDLMKAIDKLGSTPIPPYIHTTSPETVLRRQYQTIYAKTPGSVAAPTAGLHFTQALLQDLEHKNIAIEYLTLHVGLGTFKNPTPHQIETKILHAEHFSLNSDVAQRLNQAKSHRRPIVAVGTTTTRVLETCADRKGLLQPQTGSTNLFIQPGYHFKFVGHLITNFHLPQSSLLMLVSALASSPNTPATFTDFKSSLVGQAYDSAIQNNYRFFSFGDAMLIL